MVTLEHLLCPKVGGGAQTHLCPPTFESGGARAPPAPPSPTPLQVSMTPKDILMLNIFAGDIFIHLERYRVTTRSNLINICHKIR